MPKEKQKKGFFDILGFDEKDLLEPRAFSKGGGSGYSISVTYDEKSIPIVKVQTHGDVDVTELRRDIEQRYPGARIEGLEKQPLIRIVGEESTLEDERERKKERKQGEKKETERKEKKRPLIRVVE